MKALVFKKIGADCLQLKDAEKPTICDNEMLVKIHAATVTPSDVNAKGSLLILRLFAGSAKPKEAIPGVEFAGEIEAVGKSVKRFKVGDPVFGSSLSFGAWAEYIRVSEVGTLALKPINMDYAQCVGICDGGVTALLFLRDHSNMGGKKILINGASGSVGTFAVQLAKYYGAQVTGVCSTANIQLVKSLGADAVIDYTKEDFTQSNQTYDFVFDAVGKSSFSRCKRLLEQNGVYLTTVPTLDGILQKLWTSKQSGKKAVFAATGLAKDEKRVEALHLLKELAEAGKLESVIDRRYPLEQFTEALSYVKKGHKKGNVVITMDHIN